MASVHIHPGELILDYIEDRGWDQRDLARRMDVTPKYICELLAGKARLTVKMALRLELVLGRPAHLWINLQSAWDLAKARKKIGRGICVREGQKE